MFPLLFGMEQSRSIKIVAQNLQTDGIDIHALEVVSDKDKVTADVDNKIEITVKEYEVMQSVQPTNDAFVYAWQDRGILTKNQIFMMVLEMAG